MAAATEEGKLNFKEWGGHEDVGLTFMKKALEKAQAEEEAAKQRHEEEKKIQMEDAKRVRDGLKPKSSAASNVCDFCHSIYCFQHNIFV